MSQHDLKLGRNQTLTVGSARAEDPACWRGALALALAEAELTEIKSTLLGVALYAARVLKDTDGQWPPAARAADVRRGLEHIEAECRRVHVGLTANDEEAGR